MKNYSIIASKTIVASFKMEETVYQMKFGFTSKAVEWIQEQQPELQGAPWDYTFKGNNIIFNFYSLGNLVIQED